MNYPLIVIANLFVYNILSLLFLIPYLGNKNIANKSNKFNWLLLLLLCLYGVYAGDWIHYKEKLLYYIYYQETDLEFVYSLILSIVGNNYLLFRLMVWGGALLTLCALFYRLPINRFRVLGFYAIWGILFFAYARVSLGLSIFFYGLSFWLYPVNRNKILGYTWGAICIISSCFFHKSIIELCLLLPFVFIPISKHKFVLYCIIGLFFIEIVNYLTQYIDVLLLGIEGSDYFFKGASSLTVGEKIVNLSTRFPLFLLLFYLTYTLLWNDQIKKLPIFVHRYFALIIYIVLVSLVFYFSNIESKVFYYRTLYMVFIPLSIILSEVYNILSKKILLYLTIAAYLGGNYWLSYTFLGHLNGSIQ